MFTGIIDCTLGKPLRGYEKSVVAVIILDYSRKVSYGLFIHFH